MYICTKCGLVFDCVDGQSDTSCVACGAGAVYSGFRKKNWFALPKAEKRRRINGVCPGAADAMEYTLQIPGDML